MRIGTAVPSKQELAAVTHHFIQNKSIFENYTVGDFEKEAILKLNELFLNNNIQIMVGGSGLYVNAILKGIDDFPEIENSVRENINADFEQFGLDYLKNKLKELDAYYYQLVQLENPQTLENPQRMKRFVEVCIGTGKPYSSFLNQKSNQRNFTPIIFGLEAEREIIYDRINQRVDAMIKEGLVKEAESLFSYKQLNALQTVGYRELFDYFDGKISLDFAIEEIKKNTRRFSKRQITWFKNSENALWFNYLKDKNEIINVIENTIR